MQFFAGDLKFKIGKIAIYCATAFDRLWVFASCRLSMACYSENLNTGCTCAT